MAGVVRILSMHDPVPLGTVVDATSRSRIAWQRALSPFRLGPCPLYADFVSRNVENAWQFSKLYPAHADPSGKPTAEYWAWALKGWADPKPHRHPMGRNEKPLSAWWDGQALGYIEARKRIYGPLYIRALARSPAWLRLKGVYEGSRHVILLDFDGYDHVALGKSLTQVLNDPSRRMGHAFILAMLLERDPALDQIPF